MSEFKVHHHVSELMNLLGIKSEPTEGVGAEIYADLLVKNMTPYISTQISAHTALKKLAEGSSSHHEFLNKYDELKSKNIRDLDPLIYLLSKIQEDDKMKDFLEKNAKTRAAAQGTSLIPVSQVISQLPTSGSKLTPQELLLLKNELLKKANATSHLPSSTLINVKRESQAKKNVNSHVPDQPNWIHERRYLSLDFIHKNLEQKETDLPLGSLHTTMQEQILIEDLFFCMEGTNGKYIQAQPLNNRYSIRSFMLDDTIDKPLKELCSRILPICGYYSNILRFIEEKSSFKYGLVNHALASAIRILLKDFFVLMAQLEYQQRTGQLSLQKLWFYIQPTLQTLEVLSSIATSINKGELVGGAVLSLLHEKTANLIGDFKAQELSLYLIQAACVPYLEILEKWIYKGIIADPYSEFIVEEKDVAAKNEEQDTYDDDDYWEKRYTVCRERTPVFLEKVVEKILRTGKYLNVIRQCGRNVKCPHAQEIVYTLKERQYVEQIDKAYKYASKILLNLLMEEKDLMGRLRSVKHYFLLDQGDFLVQFMDMAEEEMKKNIDEIMPSRLESLLELALRTSVANSDPYKDDLGVELLPFDLINQMFKILSIETKQEKEYRLEATDLYLSGLEAFSFDYQVKWPLSLILNRKALTRYQMLFRHLFYSKHVERQLCNVWLCNKSAKLYSLNATQWFAAAFALRQRMLNFVQNFEYYMMFEVLEPNWQIFENNIHNVSNVDDVLIYHLDFLNDCLKDCMLTSPELLKIVHKIMMVCLNFSNFFQRIVQTSQLNMNTSSLDGTVTSELNNAKKEEKVKQTTKEVLQEHLDNVGHSEAYERTISNVDADFSQLLLELLDKITDFSSRNYEHKLVNIIYRLDFNGYYTEKLEKMAMERSLVETSSKTDLLGSF